MLEEKMQAAMAALIDCVELSLETKATQPEKCRAVDETWTQFLEQFLSYVRRREKETGEDLLKGISLMKLFKYL
jgi:hypothetical protein